MDKTLTVLGVDPGTRVTGYGILSHCSKGYIPLDFGCIRPPPDAPLPQKYLYIYRGMQALIEKYSPDALAVETQFVQKNAQSALKLGMARGVILLAAAEKDIPIAEYPPKVAKIAAVGSGNASKTDVQKMMQLLLKLPSPPTPEDAADALSLAFCHIQRSQSCSSLSKAF